MAHFDPTSLQPTRKRLRRPWSASSAALIMLAVALLMGCGSTDDADSADDQAAAVVDSSTTSTTTSSTPTTTEPTTTAAATESPVAPVPVDFEFASIAPGEYVVDSLGTPFTVTIEGAWFVQPNRPGWTVFSDPGSFGPSDRDVVFLRPTVLGDPTDPGACCDVIDGWPLDDIEGWLENIVDGVVVTESVATELGGQDALTFDVEISSAETCGEDYEGEGLTGPRFCIGFVVNQVDGAGNIEGYSFEPRFRVRVYWVDQGDQPPIVVLAGSRAPGDQDFFERADALLSTVVFGDAQPHPLAPARATSTTGEPFTADDFVGVWGNADSPWVIQFNADGTYLVGTEGSVAETKVESGDWRLEGTEMTFDTDFSGCPGILDRPGRYTAEMLDEAKTTVQWTVIDDPCEGRESGLVTPWTRK